MFKRKKPQECYICPCCGKTTTKWFAVCSNCRERCDPQKIMVEKTYKGLQSKTPLKRSSIKPKPTKPVDKDKNFSVLADDLHHCYITGTSDNCSEIHVHHIFRGHNKKNSEKYGFLLPLRPDWHNMSNYGIHNDRELDLKYKRLCQEYWLEHYGTQEEFIKVFGQWW